MAFERKSRRSSVQKERLVAIMHEARKHGCQHPQHVEWYGGDPSLVWPGAIEFHHVDPSTKSFSLNDGIKNGVSLAAFNAEMAKVVPWCANCHARHETANLYEWVDE